MEKVLSYLLLVGVLSMVAANTGPSAPSKASAPGGSGSKPATGLGTTGTGNFNLSSPQGVQGFLNMEGINPSSLVTSNCIANGKPCSTAGGKSCCLSPVFSCQGSPGVCRVVPAHVNHIPQIKQILQTAGYTTPNPIM